MTASDSYRVLRIVLWIFGIMLLLGASQYLFGGHSYFALRFPDCPRLVWSGWSFLYTKHAAISEIFFALLVFVVARDPMRYRTFIDLLILFFLLEAALLFVASTSYRDSFYLSKESTLEYLAVYLVWGVLLLVFRPRGAGKQNRNVLGISNEQAP
ncbi:MAG: hypothetical protein JO009_08460 [Candidatus Eremiobacteraeota bacterium]|nr:hypothetical protein [Candidatus Eremiobacteraeota bacterium]